MSKSDVSFFTISQLAVAMRKIMTEIKKMNAKRQMKNALNVQNDLFTIVVHDLFWNLAVLIFRKNETVMQTREKDCTRFSTCKTSQQSSIYQMIQFHSKSFRFDHITISHMTA